MERPTLNECAEFYQKYIDELPDGNIFELLKEQLNEVTDLLSSLSDEQARFRYAPEKWSIKQVLGHLIDAERVFSYRALCFARNDPGPLPSMEENDYVRYGNFEARELTDLLVEHRCNRLANLKLFESFDKKVQLRRGKASDCEFTVRSLPWIIAGHERHHLNVLKERYLSQV